MPTTTTAAREVPLELPRRDLPPAQLVREAACALPRVRIEADYRERGAGVIERLARRRDVQLVVKVLHVGDYLIDGRIIVERKTVPDLVASIADGRLFRQGGRLASQAGWRVPVLVVEGNTAEGLRHMTRNAMQGAIVSLALFLGIPCLRSTGPAETANLLLYAARQSCRHIERTVYRHGHRPGGKRRRRLFILQGFPGVGPARAERLLDHFGSIQAVLTATAEQLGNVAGVGVATARRIRALVSPDTRDEHGTSMPFPHAGQAP